jgi:hypothetical protein
MAGNGAHNSNFPSLTCRAVNVFFFIKFVLMIV